MKAPIAFIRAATTGERKMPTMEPERIVKTGTRIMSTFVLPEIHRPHRAPTRAATVAPSGSPVDRAYVDNVYVPICLMINPMISEANRPWAIPLRTFTTASAKLLELRLSMMVSPCKWWEIRMANRQHQDHLPDTGLRQLLNLTEKQANGNSWIRYIIMI